MLKKTVSGALLLALLSPIAAEAQAKKRNKSNQITSGAVGDTKHAFPYLNGSSSGVGLNLGTFETGIILLFELKS